MIANCYCYDSEVYVDRSGWANANSALPLTKIIQTSKKVRVTDTLDVSIDLTHFNGRQCVRIVSFVFTLTLHRRLPGCFFRVISRGESETRPICTRSTHPASHTDAHRDACHTPNYTPSQLHTQLHKQPQTHLATHAHINAQLTTRAP